MTPASRIAIYPFKRLFQTGSSSTYVQSGLATVAYHPGYDVPEKECWYINMGAVDRSFFDPDSSKMSISFGDLSGSTLNLPLATVWSPTLISQVSPS